MSLAVACFRVAKLPCGSHAHYGCVSRFGSIKEGVVTAEPSAILIVDDDADIREALVDVLTEHGYRADGAENGREALARLRSGALPSLILLDLMMPVMDGAQFRREQLRDPALASVPVIVISAGADREQQARSLGVADSLRKPVDLELLLSRIAQHVTV